MNNVNRIRNINFSSIYNIIRNKLLGSYMEKPSVSFQNSGRGTHYSTFPNDIVTYEDVKKVGLENCQAMIIDVREPDELKETGVLPGSINIPLGQLESVLKNVPNEHFLATYGREKPNLSFPIIFSCKAGTRSASAQTIAQKLGYQRVHNYSGGWLDWKEKSKS